LQFRQGELLEGKEKGAIYTKNENQKYKKTEGGSPRVKKTRNTPQQETGQEMPKKRGRELTITLKA